MRGPKPSYPITLTEGDKKELERLVRAHTTPQALALRARITLFAHAHPEQSNQQLARSLSTTDRTVRKWRGRWVKTHQLADAPRSGVPRHFPPQERAHVTAVACSLPKQEQVLEPDGIGSARCWGDRPASPLDQYHRSLAQGGTPSSLAVSLLAAYPRSGFLFATRPSGPPCVWSSPGSFASENRAGQSG